MLPDKPKAAPRTHEKRPTNTIKTSVSNDAVLFLTSLSAADRRRIFERLRDFQTHERLMRQPGLLPDRKADIQPEVAA
jgi:hypothetical protein